MHCNTHIIIISAPSGTGKSSVIKKIITQTDLRLSFSISATNRLPRGEEVNGKDYFFLSDEEFFQYIKEDQFVEFVEVYPNRFYGTLKKELSRISQEGKNLILDIDVEGAMKVKKKYPTESLSIFLTPPTLAELRKRLENRGTDSEEIIQERLRRAEYEISLKKHFDKIIVNDDLVRCANEVAYTIRQFLNKQPSQLDRL